MDQSKLEGEELSKHISISKDPQAVFPHFDVIIRQHTVSHCLMAPKSKHLLVTTYGM